MIYLELRVKMPDEELAPFLQALQGWERARREIFLAMVLEASSLRREEVAAIFAPFHPSLRYQQIERWPNDWKGLWER